MLIELKDIEIVNIVIINGYNMHTHWIQKKKYDMKYDYGLSLILTQFQKYGHI